MNVGKTKKIGCIIILCIMTFMLALIGLRVFCKLLYKIGIDNATISYLANKDENKNNNIIVNWKELYPIENAEQAKQQIEASSFEKLRSKVNNVKNKYISKVNSFENKVEKNASEDLIMYNTFLELSYLYDKMICYSLVSNNDVNARINVEGYLTRTYPYQDMNKKINNIVEFNSYLQDKGINYAYIQAPCKIEKNNEYVSKIYLNSANNNADIFLDGIKNTTKYLDFRDIVNLTKKDYLSLFFKTDHHWKPETGIWATYIVAEYLNINFAYNIDKELIGNIENYDVEVYQNSYLGSDGRYVTLANASLEDISIITPKFETDLIVKIPEKIPYKNGTFKETLIDYEKINSSDLYETDHYNAYGYGNKGLIEIHNNKINDDKKLLIIKDSFANVVAPYLALGIEDTSIIDLRYFTGSLKRYIEEYEPDTIITLYNVGLLNGNKNMFEYE